MRLSRLERIVSRKLGENVETHTVMMPRELTAENGAKAALSGEFFISVTKDCECDRPLDDVELKGG